MLDMPYEGELYIGLEDVAPLQQVSLLFQVAEGSADPDMERSPLIWQYLAADGWKPLEKDANAKRFLLEEGTDGLTRNGIVRLGLPKQICTDNPELPLNKFWLRVAIVKNRGSVCDVIGIHTQAVRAVRVLESSSLESGGDDPGNPIPLGTLSALVVRRSEVKRIVQPYSSYGGRSPEDDTHYYARVSELLRHKNRSLSIWDIEHLVLEQFSDVYKVKCLPNGVLSDTSGQADIIIIPNLRGRMPMDPFQPRLPMARLDEIGAWLQAHAPEAAQYRVRNARFLQITIETTVQMRPDFDPAYYKEQLDAELTRFLAPWAFDDSADIAFGSTIYAGQILNFIEERPYIDFVTNLSLIWEDFEGKRQSTFDALPPPEPNVVWVSAQNHTILLVDDIVEI